jgi:general L-amino acid transport system permease protein
VTSAPVIRRETALGWAQRNLFNNWYNAVLTFVLAIGGSYVLYRGLRFVFVTARWEIIRRNMKLLLVGFFPRDQLWRVWAALYILAIALAAGAAIVRRRAAIDPADEAEELITTPVWRRILPVILLVVVIFTLSPDVTAMVLVGGLAAAVFGSWRFARGIPFRYTRAARVVCVLLIVAWFALLIGFGGVALKNWGGLLLTLFLAASGILLSFPIGVLLAVGRRSSLPVIRVFSTGYIELIRGVPLVTLLFMAFFVIGFLVPQGSFRPNAVIRALIAFVMFTSAYIAEIVRGGLQSVPREQTEAALAVGLTPLATLRLIVLPQALRNVIPALVGQFISLFKDTSLAVVIGLSELLGLVQALTSQRDFTGQQLQAETLVFAAFVYWVGSYTMSKESQRLEQRLGVGVR